MSFLRKNIFSLLRLGFSYVLGRDYPFITVLRLNDSCNLSCSYCDSYKMNESIEIQTLLAFLDRVYARGCRSFVLTGGEPFLYKNRAALMSWFQSKNKYLSINTNGKLINSEEYKEFLLMADNVLVSLDGPEEITDRYRGSGTFKNALKTLDFLEQKKIKPTLSTVLTRESTTVGNLQFLMDLKLRYKASIGLSPVSENGRINNTEYSLNHQLQDEQLLLLKQFVVKNQRHFPELNVELLNYFIKPQPFHCKTKRFAVYVDVDQNIYPCVNVTGRSDAQLATISNYGPKFTKPVYCAKCSCTQLILGNLLLQKDIPDWRLATLILKRYL